jgi:hypothetical protein
MVFPGEFGPIYEKKDYNPDFEEHDNERYNMLDKQMAIYTSESIGTSNLGRLPLRSHSLTITSAAWSIWCYKDINVMGLAYVSPDSPYLKLLDPIIRKKRDLAVDSWAYDDAHLQDGLFGPLHKWFEDNVPAQYSKKYPWQWRMHMHVFRGIRGITMSEYMVQEWADYFEGKTFEELDALAASWKIENCVQRERLNELLKLYAPMKADDVRLEGKVIPAEAEKSALKANESVSGVGVFELSPEEQRKRAMKVETVEVRPVAVVS